MFSRKHDTSDWENYPIFTITDLPKDTSLELLAKGFRVWQVFFRGTNNLEIYGALYTSK